MKKFSTAIRFLALASMPVIMPFTAFMAPTASAAETQNSAQSSASKCAFLPNAPDQHTVVRGDTLWDISGKFLEHPWCWPQVWGLNRDQIRDPHWIYPGQIVYFDREAGRLRLGGSAADQKGQKNDPRASTVVRLSPQIRMQGLDAQAIPAIPSNVIEPFLLQPLIVEENELQNTPRIFATQEGRVHLGKNDRAYVRGDLKGGTSFQAFRPGKPLKDPENGKIIGYEAVYLGALKLQRPAQAENEVHSFTVVASKEEMGVGDHLLPVPPAPMLNYVPHPPEKQIAARIVSVHGGVSQAGQNQVVSINRGKNDGIDTGTVLELYRYGESIPDRSQTKFAGLWGGKKIKLPDERYGSLFIFRVFPQVSYGLVMQVTDAVQIGDVAKSPE